MEVAMLRRRSARRSCVLMFLGLAVAGSTAISSARPLQDAKPPTVLFMCPHGAAKSVLASAYFQRAARERGLNVRVISAGTDPDEQVAPVVAKHLKANGYEVPIVQPRRATADDMAQADVVISIGCDLKDLPAPRGAIQTWDDVPPPSEDFAAADAKIKERVMQLIDELARQQKR